jgi:hypothetical protein
MMFDQILQKANSHDNSRTRMTEIGKKRRKSGNGGFVQYRHNCEVKPIHETYLEESPERGGHIDQIEADIASYYSPMVKKVQARNQGSQPRGSKKMYGGHYGYESPGGGKLPVKYYPVGHRRKETDGQISLSSTNTSDEEREASNLRATRVYFGGRLVFNTEKKHCKGDGFESSTEKDGSNTLAHHLATGNGHYFACSALKSAPEELAHMPLPLFKA